MKWSSALLGATVAGLTVRAVARARRRESFSLEGKVVVVTGGSRGLGLEIASQLARERARIVLVARDADELARAERDLGRGVDDVLTVAADVSLPAGAREVARRAIHKFGNVDALINCAGQIMVGPVTAMSHEDFERAMNANFWSAQNCVEALLPALSESGDARIVNISSIGGLVGVPHLSPYVASKFALTGYSLTLRAELESKGIRVVTVCPGLMRTGSPGKAVFKGDVVAEYAGFKLPASLPLLSMNAEHAAHEIVRAMQAGQTRLILTTQAKIAALLETLTPGLVAQAAALATGLAERFLDSNQVGAASDGVRGDAIPDVIPAFATVLGDAATVRNNERSA